jgi:predicted O-methyltransferase YrrM
MRLSTLIDGLRGVNICTVELLLKRRDQARSYVSSCVRQCDELLRRGLPARDPVTYLRKMSASREETAVCSLPAQLHDGGGTRLEELVYLAAVTRLLQPRRVFEIGTFRGRTTAIFALNAPEAEIITLDLPPDYTPGSDYIDTDADLVRTRKVAEFVGRYGVQDRVRQIFADSMRFDPAPYAGTVQLAFVDGAHTYAHVKNDTEKIAVMMAADGIVLWHDYGGKGEFRGVTDHLHELGSRAQVYRIGGTTLAWTTAENLRTALALSSVPASEKRWLPSPAAG